MYSIPLQTYDEPFHTLTVVLIRTGVTTPTANCVHYGLVPFLGPSILATRGHVVLHVRVVYRDRVRWCLVNRGETRYSGAETLVVNGVVGGMKVGVVVVLVVVM